MPAVSFEGDHLVHEFYDDGSEIRVELARDDKNPQVWHADIAWPTGIPVTDEDPAMSGKHALLSEGRLAKFRCPGLCDAMESWYLMVIDRSDGVQVASKNHHWLRAGEGLWKPKFS